MAVVQIPGPKFTLKSADAFYIGNAEVTYVSTWAIMLVSNTFSGSITIKSRIQGDVAAADSVVPVAVCYQARFINGSVGTDAIVSTAITGTSLIIVPATGQSIVIDCTSFTSGSMTVYAYPYAGAAA